MVQGLWFRIYGSGFIVQGLWFRGCGAGFVVQGVWFRVQGVFFTVRKEAEELPFFLLLLYYSQA